MIFWELWKWKRVSKLSEIQLTFFYCAELVKIKYQLIPHFVLISLFLLSLLLLLCLLPFWCLWSSCLLLSKSLGIHCSWCLSVFIHLVGTTQFTASWGPTQRTAFKSASQSAACKPSYLYWMCNNPSTIMSVTVVLNFYFITPVRKRNSFIWQELLFPLLFYFLCQVSVPFYTIGLEVKMKNIVSHGWECAL